MNPFTFGLPIVLAVLFLGWIVPRISRTFMSRQGSGHTTTLGEFIEVNHNLLTPLGIFTALTVFASNLQPKVIGHSLSFLFLAITILLLAELSGRFPKLQDAGGTLFWFASLLTVAGVALTLRWFIEFRDVLRPFMGTFLIASFILAYVYIDAQVEAIRARHDETVSKWWTIERNVAHMAGTLLSIILGALLADAARDLLDFLATALASAGP